MSLKIKKIQYYNFNYEPSRFMPKEISQSANKNFTKLFPDNKIIITKRKVVRENMKLHKNKDSSFKNCFFEVLDNIMKMFDEII